MSAAPQLYVEDANDVFDYETDWKEFIGNESPVSSRFSATDQSTTLTGWIPANKKRSAMRHFLGYSYADDTAPYALHRELPARHPEFPNLYAYDASFSDLVPLAGDDEEHEVVPGTWKESPFEGSQEETMFFAGYSQCMMTVQFKSFGRMRFLPDSDISDYKDEYKRFVTFNTEPSTEALTADGASQLYFREGGGTLQPYPGSTPPNPATPPTAFPAPIAELMGKVALTLKWHAVPHNYLSTDPDICLLDKIIGRWSLTDTPTNIADWPYPPILGTINKDYFLGYYPGTLLLRAIKVEEVLYPVTTADPYDIAGGYNVTFVWEHFDPIRGKAFVADLTLNPANYDSYRGHRLFPWRQDGQWYAATREDPTKGMLPLVDHWRVFQSALDVS